MKPLLPRKNIKCYKSLVCLQPGYAARKARASYYYIVVCGLSDCTIFSHHYLIKDTTSGKKQFFFSFFFYWRYNPLWVLAFSVIFFHSALCSHCFLHRLTPIICRSSSKSAIHLFRGLPLVLVPIGFHCNILLGVLISSIRIT